MLRLGFLKAISDDHNSVEAELDQPWMLLQIPPLVSRSQILPFCSGLSQEGEGAGNPCSATEHSFNFCTLWSIVAACCMCSLRCRSPPCPVGAVAPFSLCIGQQSSQGTQRTACCIPWRSVAVDVPGSPTEALPLYSETFCNRYYKPGARGACTMRAHSRGVSLHRPSAYDNHLIKQTNAQENKYTPLFWEIE